MKDSLRFVYRRSILGWIKVRECQSFRHACLVALQLTEQTGFEHCVWDCFEKTDKENGPFDKPIVN